jgi:hypothetical protein
VTKTGTIVETLPPAELKEAIAALWRMPHPGGRFYQTILTPYGAKARLAGTPQVELLVHHDLLEIFDKPQLSECPFDGDLPERNDADHDTVVGVANLVTYSSGKPWRPIAPPSRVLASTSSLTADPRITR